MKLSETVGGSYLKAIDLPGDPKTLAGTLILTIKGSKINHFKDGNMSLDLSFFDDDKIFGCNVTNRKRLGQMTDDADIDQLTYWQIKLGKEYDRDMNGGQIIGVRIQGARMHPSKSSEASDSTPSQTPQRPARAQEATAEEYFGNQAANTSISISGESMGEEPPPSEGFGLPDDDVPF